MNITQFAEETGRDRKTIRKWLQKNEPESYRLRNPRIIELEPFKGYFRARMAEGCINARIIYDEKKHGYTEKETNLRDFMKPFRSQFRAKATKRYETLPRQQAQVDCKNLEQKCIARPWENESDPSSESDFILDGWSKTISWSIQGVTHEYHVEIDKGPRSILKMMKRLEDLLKERAKEILGRK